VLALFIVAIELGITYGVGWFVDVIQTTPETIVDYAVPGLIALVGFFLLVRLALFGLHVLVFNQMLGVNVAALVRWWAYRQVVRHLRK